MRWLVLVGVLLVVVGAYTLVSSARHLGEGVAEFSSEHAVSAGAPRLLNAAGVPLSENVALFSVLCESDAACGGNVTVTLANGKVGVAEYAIDANQTRQLGVLLPPGTRAKHGTLT